MAVVYSKFYEESREMIRERAMKILRRRFAIEKMQVIDELMRDEDGRTIAEAHGEALEIRLGRLAVRIALYTRIY